MIEDVWRRSKAFNTSDVHSIHGKTGKEALRTVELIYRAAITKEEKELHTQERGMAKADPTRRILKPVVRGY